MPLEVPTDNLYKFIAVGGVALTLASMYCLAIVVRDAAEGEYQYARRKHEHEASVDSWISEGQHLDRRQEVLSDDFKQLAKDAPSLEDAIAGDPVALKKAAASSKAANQALLALLDSQSKLDSDRRELMKRGWTLQPEAQAIAIEVAFQKVRQKRETSLFMALSFGCMLGVAAAALGFSLWYVRLQRFVDADIAGAHRNRAAQQAAEADKAAQASS